MVEKEEVVVVGPLEVEVKEEEVAGLLEEEEEKEVVAVADGQLEEVGDGQVVEEVEDGRVVEEVEAAGRMVEQLKTGGERYLV